MNYQEYEALMRQHKAWLVVSVVAWMIMLLILLTGERYFLLREKDEATIYLNPVGGGRYEMWYHDNLMNWREPQANTYVDTFDACEMESELAPLTVEAVYKERPTRARTPDLNIRVVNKEDLDNPMLAAVNIRLPSARVFWMQDAVGVFELWLVMVPLWKVGIFLALTALLLWSLGGTVHAWWSIGRYVEE